MLPLAWTIWIPKGTVAGRQYAAACISKYELRAAAVTVHVVALEG
jgi:hypothetical protein